jgi:GntR family transcriptional regulator / MocR family aminotransferase
MASKSEVLLTSSAVEVLASVNRDNGKTLRRQIEDQLRRAIRAGVLKKGSRVASTRDLAKQLGVSRPVVVEAYAQLAAEGYLEIKQGTLPRVSGCVGACREPKTIPQSVVSGPHVDFRTGRPDLSAFPRSAWLRSLRNVLTTIPHEELDYGDPRGADALRHALSEYLGRVRGLVTDAQHIVVVNGFAQGRVFVARALAASGITRVAVEDPCQAGLPVSVKYAGLTVIPIPVDQDGIRVDVLEKSNAEAVFLTPAHQYPTGAVMSGERRAAVLKWLRDRKAIALEDDYDAEYRYDRAPVGALQALEPARIIYGGTTSKTLAPALRLGWLVVPPSLLETVAKEQRSMDYGAPRIDQHAFADFLTSGELDRHLRRQRTVYRARRDALIAALAKALPEATVFGISAGLHATVGLPHTDDVRAIQEEASRRGIAVSLMLHNCIKTRGAPPTLLLGYAGVSEASIRVGVTELAAAVRATRGKRRR